MKKSNIAIQWLLPILCFGNFGLANTMQAQSPIKNVIVMIPDGCSTDLLALGRWVQDGIPLALDEQICGLVRTYCSDSPIGDSAPTGSTYASGHRSKAGYVSTFPDTTMQADGTRIPSDTTMAFRPLFTLMEAARLQGMRTGMVVTCHFTDATPASFLSHTPNRREYFRISKQMVHQPCDVLLGGGSYYIDSAQKHFGFDAPAILNQKGINYTTDYASCLQLVQQGVDRLWGIFAPSDMAYEVDRNPQKEPSLEQMTQMAIRMLSAPDSSQGFFLMVEGSKIDWGEHNNDMPAIMYDFLAFDKAVASVLDFAKKDGQTLVVILPDHQTGGLKMGSRLSEGRYARTKVSEWVDPIKNYKVSYAATVKTFGKEATKEQIQEVTLQNYQIELSTSEIDTLAVYFRKYGGISDISVRCYARILNTYQHIGFTTHGHTGGDVFLAMYHPHGNVLNGVVDNEKIAPYIAQQLQWTGAKSLDSLTRRYYVKPKEIRNWDKDKTVYSQDKKMNKIDPLYRELRSGKNVYRLYPNTDYIEKNGKRISAGGLVVFNGMEFYLPAACLSDL